MGIQDRDYYRMGPRSRSGLGGLRVVSFNTWLIVINVAVFVLNNWWLGANLVMVDGSLTFREQAPQAARDSAVVVRSRVLSDPAARRFYYPIHATLQGPAGVQVGPEIGRLEVFAMPLPQALGHFSTGRGFMGVDPSRRVVFGLEVWRFITFQFLHVDEWHLFFNLFGLWVFGGMVEQYLGFKRYAAFYLVCGVFGAVGYLLLNFLGNVAHLSLPGVLINDIYTPLIGASAGVFGVIMAAAFIAPSAVVVIPIPPIPMRLWVMAYGYVGIALVNLLVGGKNAGGDAAHVGGAIAGFFFIRNSHLLRDFFEVFGGDRGGARGGGSRGASADDGEIDRILAKVSDSGLGSLTGAEREYLHRHAERLRLQGGPGAGGPA